MILHLHMHVHTLNLSTPIYTSLHSTVIGGNSGFKTQTAHLDSSAQKAITYSLTHTPEDVFSRTDECFAKLSCSMGNYFVYTFI